MTRLLLLALLPGCAAADTVPVTVSQHLHADETVDVEELLSEAGDVLGVQPVPVDDAPIRVVIEHSDSPVGGWTIRHDFRAGRICPGVSTIRTVPSGVVLAHELGHALGLGHLHHPRNLMTPSITGTELEPHQIDRIESTAARYWVCPGVHP